MSDKTGKRSGGGQGNLPFDMASLIPQFQPAKVQTQAEPPPARPPRRDFPYLLATAMHGDNFHLPQLLLLGKQMTRGPSPVRVLLFGPSAVLSDDLRRTFLSLPPSEQRAIEAFLWFDGCRWDEQAKKVLDVPPDFRPAADAFTRLYRRLEVGRLLKRAHTYMSKETQPVLAHAAD